MHAGVHSKRISLFFSDSVVRDLGTLQCLDRDMLLELFDSVILVRKWNVKDVLICPPDVFQILDETEAVSATFSSTQLLKQFARDVVVLTRLTHPA